MTERDLQRILQESVQDVHLSAKARRNIRLAAKEERPVRSKKFVALILVLILTLTASVGIAAELGMFDFLARMTGDAVLPGAYDLVESDIAYGETDHVSYTVKQAAYDGQAVALMVEMRPKDDKTFLMGPMWMLEDRISGYIYDTEEEAQADSRTIAEYAAENGYTRIVDVSVGRTLDPAASEWKDNVLTVVYAAEAEGDTLTLPLSYNTYDYTTGTVQRVADEITLQAAAPLWTVSSQQSFDAPGFGIRVDGITITGTPVQSYWTVHYTITDAETARSTPWNANVVDMDMKYIDSVLVMGGSARPEYDGQQLTYTGTITAMQQPPTELMILLRNWDDHSLNNYFPVTLK